MNNSNFTNGWNWKRARPGVSAIMCVLAMTIFNLQAVKAEQADLPDPELLEFLAESIQVEKEFIDPVAYREIEQVTRDLKRNTTSADAEHD